MIFCCAIVDHNIIGELVDMVKAGVPFLVGFDLSISRSFIWINVGNHLNSTQLDIWILLVFKYGQVYLEWSKNDMIIYRVSYLKYIAAFLTYHLMDPLNLLKLFRLYENHSKPEKYQNRSVTDRTEVSAVLYQQFDLYSRPKMRNNWYLKVDHPWISCYWVMFFVLFVVDTQLVFLLQYSLVNMVIHIVGLSKVYGKHWHAIDPRSTLAIKTVLYVIKVWYLRLWNQNQYLTANGFKGKFLAFVPTAHKELVKILMIFLVRQVFEKLCHEYWSASCRTNLKVASVARNGTMGENKLALLRLLFEILPGL